MAGAALKQLDGGQYSSSIPGLSHPDAVMVAHTPCSCLAAPYPLALAASIYAVWTQSPVGEQLRD